MDTNGTGRVVKTGTAGLDDILMGGLPGGHLYLVEGDPGTGKTTLAMQFLIEGAKAGEKSMYVSLSETERDLRVIAESHHWDLDGIDIVELPADYARLDNEYSVFHASEVELTDITKMIRDRVEETEPRRLVLDSLSEVRLLAGDPLRYRRQILALKQFFSGQNCTVLLLEDRTASRRDLDVGSISHGVIALEYLPRSYGAERRRIRIAKMRGLLFRSGYHDYDVLTGGLQVFPRLVAAEYRGTPRKGSLESGIPELDALLGGGIDAGTSNLILGPAGAGKSTIAAHYVCAAGERGDRSVMYTFDENRFTLLKRAADLGADLTEYLDKGLVRVEQVDPAELSPGEFVHNVRHEVEHNHAAVIVIDSLNGLLNAMPEEDQLPIQLHELLAYLNQRGVITIMVLAQYGILGDSMQTPADVSYLADTVILLRYFEAAGAVRQAISVVKRRTGGHERTVRELWLARGGIRLGDPLTEFSGILTGTPEYRGPAAPLMHREGARES